MLNIIIPTYNSSKTIRDTLNSLVCQTKKTFMVSIVEDASGDDIQPIIEEYFTRLNIGYFVLEENLGAGCARQFILDKSEMFDYVMFLDGDDMILPQGIEFLYREATKKKPDIITSNFLMEVPGDRNRVIKNSNLTWIHGKLYKTKFLHDNGIRFLEGIKVNEDGAFNVMAYSQTENVLAIDEVTHLWRANPESLTRKFKSFLLDRGDEFLKSQCLALEFIVNKDKVERHQESYLIKSFGSVFHFYQFLRQYRPQHNEACDAALQRLCSINKFKNIIEEKKDFRLALGEQVIKYVPNHNFLYLPSENLYTFFKKFGVNFDANCDSN